MSFLKELKVPAFKAGGQPEIDLQTYSLSIGGLIEEDRHFSWAELLAMPRSVVNCRLTSVSGWSVRANWEGIVWRDFIKKVPVLSGGDHARFTSMGGGYTTVVSLKDLGEPRVLLAIGVNGEPIEPEYGGPLRMIIPNLWGYKSCKWVERIDFIGHMEGGYWEDRGYTCSGIIEPGFTFDVNTKTRRPIKGGEVIDF